MRPMSSNVLLTLSLVALRHQQLTLTGGDKVSHHLMFLGPTGSQQTFEAYTVKSKQFLVSLQ